MSRNAKPSNPQKTKASSPFRSGLLEGVFGPGLGTFAAMTGFGALASDGGTPLWAAVVLTIGVWSMPGQVAFVDLYSAGATLLVVLVTVTVANVRMFPLTVATIPMLRKGTGVKPSHFILAHLNSVTSFVRLGDFATGEPGVEARLKFYTAFTLGTFVVGTAGTIVGFTLAGNLPPPGVQALVFVTPLYLLLLTARSPNAQILLSVVAGGVLVPAFFAWMGGLGIVAGGLVAGTLVFLATMKRRADG